MPASSSLLIRDCSSHIFVSDAQRAKALFAELLEMLLDSDPACRRYRRLFRFQFPLPEQTASTFRNAPFVTIRCVSAWATRMLNRLRRKS